MVGVNIVVVCLPGERSWFSITRESTGDSAFGASSPPSVVPVDCDDDSAGEDVVDPEMLKPLHAVRTSTSAVAKATRASILVSLGWWMVHAAGQITLDPLHTTAPSNAACSALCRTRDHSI